MTDPFFLLTLSGSAIGIAFGFAVRRPKRSGYPLRARHRQAVGIPVALIAASVLAGGAFLTDGALIIEWWRWAAALSAGALVYTMLVLLAQRWWRAAMVAIIVIPIIPAFDAWMALPFDVPSLALPCRAPGLVLYENEDARSDEPTLALVRVDPPLGEADPRVENTMAVRVLPVVDVTAGEEEAAVPGAAGVWQPVGQASAADTVRIEVRLERYFPPLWWFPTSERVTELSIIIGEQSASLSASSGRIPHLERVRSLRTVHAEMPTAAGQYLQPGVYALEYSCGATDTQDV